jgi:hypothetical protein
VTPRKPYRRYPPEVNGCLVVLLWVAAFWLAVVVIVLKVT